MYRGSGPPLLGLFLTEIYSRVIEGQNIREGGGEGFGIEVEPLSHTKLCMPTAHGGLSLFNGRFWLALATLIHYSAML